jgi:hypothetical protein
VLEGRTEGHEAKGTSAGSPVSHFILREAGLISRTYNVVVLEAELWTERNSQVVARSAVEINVVANFSAQPNRSDEALEAPARINREVGCAIGQTDGVDESGLCALVVNGEVVESNFARHK